MKGCPVRNMAGILFILLVVCMLLYVIYGSKEGFENPILPARCGVDLPPCQGEHVRCMNGYCTSDIASILPPISDLPLSP
jgi:hypothetical protein